MAACAVSPLEGFKAHEWVCFERALVVRDLFTGGVRTFFSNADAQHFRTRLYQHYSALYVRQGLAASKGPRREQGGSGIATVS